MTKTLVLCDCLASQEVDAKGIEKSTGLKCSRVYNFLCGDQLADAAGLLAQGDVIIACQQERQTFEDLAEEVEAPQPGFVDLRDRAGWGDDGASALPKMAALVAEAALPAQPIKSLDIVSEGTCLIVGASDAVLPAAAQLCGTLAVTALLTDAGEPPQDRRFDVVHGRLSRVSGSLGQFEVEIDGFRALIPAGRGAPQMTAPQDGAISECDILIDLTGGQPFVSAPQKRDGYLRADPKGATVVAATLMEAAQMVGTFEKPLYVALEPSLCAHSRAEKPACSRCLDLCPTGAITPDGEHVAIDPLICAGCGACSAVCPSGAITYDAPAVDTTFRRLWTLANTYRAAGGKAPRLLVHDDDHGAQMIQLAARYGRGLPADVIPFETTALAGFGHAEMLAAMAAGFSTVELLLSPTTEKDAPLAELALAQALSGKASAALIEPADPDALCAHLFDDAAPAKAKAKDMPDPSMPLGTRRQVARVAAQALNPGADHIDLPDGAPYGAVLVDTGACSLCLSCVSLCPAGALGDNPDRPQLRFQEDACLQCGLCANICPEDAITYQPRMNLADSALSQVVLHEEEPFACIECGSLFGVKSTVDKVVEKLAGKHSMFATTQASRMIQMCDNCRINAQMHLEGNPFSMGSGPGVNPGPLANTPPSKRRDH